MDDEAEVVMANEDHADVRTSNKLDLNVGHGCRSPKSYKISWENSSCSMKNEILKIGMEFDSDELAYRFYGSYAELVGFSIRKDWVNRSKVHGRVMSRKFTCSRQGHRKKDKRDVNVKKHRKETRTGCLAHMVITRQPNGKYVVSQFDSEHNHDDVDLSKAQMVNFPSSGTKFPDLDSVKNLEIKSKSSLQLLGVRFSTPETVDDFQMSDDILLRSERARDMKEGDASRLLYCFQRQHFENPSFFYSLQVDIDDKISNIFWADDHMIADYGYFGDVVCVDTSCMRNPDCRPFVLFIGLNNHRQVVIFGAALLYDNSIDSFKWLFRTFLEGMSGKKPKFIMSDQDATIVQACHAVLPETIHCMCAWLMYLIALKQLRHEVKKYDSFAIDFRNCIFCFEEEEDFIQAWDAMLERHCLRHNPWLRWMFKEKEKWAVAYGKNTFFLERSGNHLVELISNKFRDYLSPDLDVLQFFKYFVNVVNEQRRQELESTFDMGRHAPVLMANSVLLKHPSEIYTPKAFDLFQREYEKCLNLVVDKCGEQDSSIHYKAKIYGKTKEFSVVYNSLDGSVSCNCKKFEHVGLLCSHALKVLDHQNIKIVPSCYILKRWTKNARVSHAGENYDSQADNNREIVASRYKALCRDIIKISARAAQSDPAFEFASRQLNEIMQGVEKILTFKSSEEPKSNYASDEELTDAVLGTKDSVAQGVDGLKETSETESMIPDKDQLNQSRDKIPSSSSGLNAHSAATETALPAACDPSTYMSPPSPMSGLSPLPHVRLGLYGGIEANHMVHNMYQSPQASNLTINQQADANIYESPNFYPNHSQFLRESLLRNQFHVSMSHETQLRPVTEDNHYRHSSSLMTYNHRYTAGDI